MEEQFRGDTDNWEMTADEILNEELADMRLDDDQWDIDEIMAEALAAEPTPEEPPQEPEPVRKKSVFGKVTYYALMAVFVGVFIYCAVYIAGYMVDSKQTSGSYDQLSDYLDQYRDPNGDRVDVTLPSAITSGGENTDIEESKILPEYRDFYASNKDMIGWITVPGTKIDYPVMQTPGVPNYYLYRGFDGRDNLWGCIYAREACDVFMPSDNVVLYGHHMRDGSMFAGLDAYMQASYWKDHQTFSFNTLYERHTYQIFAVFKTSANIGKGFSYHTFNTAQNQEEFEKFIKTVHSLQFYNTGVTAEYGDMLLTLSTCEYTLDNGRLVVVAKRIS